MIYKCLRSDCGYLFQRTQEPEQCPDCGWPGIRRPATAEEIKEYDRNHASEQAAPAP